MKTLVLLAMLFGATVTLAVPSVTVNGVSQGAGRKVVVDYTLTGAPAIVTVDFQVNGQSVSHVREVWGDVNRLVSTDGAHTLVWNPDRDCPGLDVTAGNFKAVVNAWSPTTPPDYMVVDLEVKNTVSYYTSMNALPDGGLTNDVYRTTRMVFRRIPAKDVQWVMGSPWTDPSRDEAKEATHRVTLTADYYMGVFEVTQAQFLRVQGTNPSKFAGFADSPIRACDNVSDYLARGTGHQGIAWPQTETVLGASFMGKLRTWVGNAMKFDLPTEAQWEYACRAGKGTAFNTGVNVWDDSIGWGAANSAVAGVIQPHPVGQKRPNDWGLYDMHGNVSEWCLDWACDARTGGSGWQAYGTEDVVDPVGPAWTTSNIWDPLYHRVRGGSCGDVQNVLRAGARSGWHQGANWIGDLSNDSSRRAGIRVCCPIGSGVTL